MLIQDIKNLILEISSKEIVHLEPTRIKIYLSGLVESEDRRMSDYKTGVIPNLVRDLNEMIDLINDVKYKSGEQEDELFNISQRLSIVRDTIVREL
tara:strand:+ start:2080 stop:2367 length:288 start_codon:yes stop_codon:yes gene_type:complete